MAFGVLAAMTVALGSLDFLALAQVRALRESHDTLATRFRMAESRLQRVTSGEFDFIRARGISIESSSRDAIAVWIGTCEDGSGTIETRGADGQKLFRVARTEVGGFAATYNTRGEALVKLSSADDAGVLAVYGQAGEPIALLGTTCENHNGALSIRTVGGGNLVSLYSGDQGEGLLKVFNPEGLATVRIWAGAGSGNMGLYSDDDSELVRVGANRVGFGIVRTSDHLGRGLASMSSDQFNRGLVTVHDPEKQLESAFLLVESEEHEQVVEWPNP